MDNRRKHGRNDDGVHEDTPMYSRLFIVCERRVTEEQFKDEFAKFGVIEDVKMPRDYNTGEPKGIAFIKFAKTSDAANALEQMNRTVLPNTTRPLKIMVAANRSEIQSDDNDEDKYKRLFLTIPKNMNEDEVEDIFGKYGHVESVQVQRDRNSGEPKGFAYVKFSKFSEAADAFESCDKRYRAVFALPKGYNRRQETAFEHNVNSLASSSNNMRASLLSMMNPSQAKGFTKIDFMCCPYLNQFQLEGLFNIIPGMQHCQFFVDWPRNCGKGTVSYSNPVSASYAVERLNRFEYPPGMKIFVRPTNQKFDPQEEKFSNLPKLVNNLKGAIASTVNSATPDLAQLAEAVAEASKVIKMATAGVLDDEVPSSSDLNYCSVKLPPPQPLADIDSNVAKRCFLVCKPVPPTLPVLRDIFCRFGDLINVYTLPNKTVGYARYASVAAAENAIKTLHGAEVCGVRMKVLEADEEAPSKRPRWD